MTERHGRIAGAEPHRLAGTAPVRRRRSGEAPEIVEADLRPGKAGKLCRRLRVQITQHTIAEPVVGQRAQLFLDGLERAPERPAARHRLLDIERAGVEPHREQAGEPAHRARQVDILEHLLAPMSLEVEQHRAARSPPAPPAPVRNRHHQAGQQHIVDAAMEGRRHPRQQRSRERRRQRERETPGRAVDVADWIERAVDQRQRRRIKHPAPERKLRDAAAIARMRRQPLRPAAKRGSPRRRRRHAAARNRLPRRRKLRHQDAPRHPVHRQMMDRQQQPAARLRAGVEPDCRNHHPRRRVEPALGRRRRLRDAGPQPRLIKPANVDPAQAVAGNDSAGRQHLEAPRRARRQDPGAVATRRDDRAGLQGGDEMIALQPRRHLQQHRLAEALDRPAALQQPVHDRRRRQGASGDLGNRGGRLCNQTHHPRQRGDGLMLEHRARRDHQPGLARPAHQLDRHDAVAAEREEVVVDPHTLEPKHLRKQTAQDLLLRRARSPPHRPNTMLRRRQRTTVELAVGRQRKPIQNHERRRHHVLGKALPQMRPQRCRIQHRIPRRHHIANQPLAAGAVLARNHRRLRNIPHGEPAPPRSRPARCGSRAPSPAHPRAPGTPARRRPASAPGPRCGTSGSPPGRTGPQRTVPPSAPHAPHSPAPAPHPQCKAPHQPPQEQAPNLRPERKPACSRSDDRSERRA